GLYAPAFAWLIFELAHDSRVARWLDVKPLRTLGEASYSLYLIHLAVIIYVSHYTKRIEWTTRHPALAFAGAALLASALSIAAEAWLERPARRWFLQRFSAGGRRAPVGSPAMS